MLLSDVHQDLTVKIASQCGEDEISLEDDELQLGAQPGGLQIVSVWQEKT